MAVVKLTTKPKARRNGKRKAKIDSTPSWEGQEEWSSAKYAAHFRNSLQYYNLAYSGKEMKPRVIDWMIANKYPTKKIKAFKATNDWRVSITMGSIAANLLKGMPAVRNDFNQGRNCEEWLRQAIETVIENGANDKRPSAKKENKPTISIQDRLRNVAIEMSAEIDAEFEKLLSNVKGYKIKEFKPLNILRAVEAKAAHARIIKTIYENDLAEFEELLVTEDKDLLEAYSHLSKSEIKKIVTFLREVDGACSMIAQEGKVSRTPRKKKPKSKDKLIEKLNYKKSDTELKLVSINPADIVGASELWVYNTKTRKIGKYIAKNIDPKNLGRDGTGLSIKGTTIIDFDETASIQKTLRKPKEQIPEFVKSGKVKLRKFLDNIKAVDIKLNGRINPEIILLKAVK